MIELQGKSVSTGIAIGKILFFQRNTYHIPEYTITDIDAELKRLDDALKSSREKMQRLYQDAVEKVGKNQSLIFQIHQMILEDSKFYGHAREVIQKQHKNCEFAVKTTGEYVAGIFRSMDDEYLQARANDVIDASNTLLSILIGSNNKSNFSEEPSIIAADDLLPSETISFKKENILGFITNSGSQNSHTAILSRTMELPSVVQVKSTLQEYNGMYAILDGQSGKIFIDPDRSTLTLYRAKKERYLKQRMLFKRQIGLPSVTKDGKKVILSANIGLLDDISAAQKNDAEGIGLFRSEFLFIERKSAPDEEEQFTAYRTVLKAAGEHRAIIRTIDIGADKSLDYLNLPKEENPVMGCRGVRLCLQNQEIFITQLRALLRASVYGHLGILIPMIISLEEIDAVKRIIEKVKYDLRSEGISYADDIQLGIMIETPAAAMISDYLAKEVDFFSIGTNDLTQYGLAIDRQNEHLESFYQPHHKAILRLIKTTIDNAHKAGIWCSICGELAADTRLTPLFLSMGIDEMSMVPSKILPVRAKVREITLENKKEILRKTLE
ncbi:MAG: phosphoenolpyruvate--protein phosphotransferase [Acutalibacteraceae bacterium]